MSEFGIVTIGRNEGERLRRCLDSVVGLGHTVVYVDSGSTDGSVELARAKGAEVVALDMSQPFTMARGRNAGFARLEEISPQVRFVQFVDGDCEVIDGWLETALATLNSRQDVAIVSGRRRERFPDQSVYNRLADIEWDTPIGEARYCGGDAMIRVEAFKQAGGYNPKLIAGEEPDLAVRIRQHGWRILRIDAEMTLHDMAMTRFSQWWRRNIRSGFAFAEGAALHGKPPERHWAGHVRSIIFWAMLVPLVIVVLAWPTHGMSLLLALVYPLQVIRVARHYKKAGLPTNIVWIYSGACVLGRFPNAIGAVRYWVARMIGRRQAIIEYKRN
jgi:glycosyltransferase involved in cell wall biosynthesis